MTKKEAKELAKKYNMEIVRNEITGEGLGAEIDSNEEIAELEEMIGKDIFPCRLEPFRYGEYGVTYRLYVPTDWIDLWGWR